MAKSEAKFAQPSGAGEASESDLRLAGRSVSFAEAFRFWVKLGFISFGGPDGQIAIMRRELVERPDRTGASIVERVRAVRG
jgi:hypothetical protein